MNILVADDEKRIVCLLKEFFDEKGHAVETAYDGQKAWELIKEKDFDIVFLDENMPGLTGLEIVGFIKKNGLRVKSVILTGYPCISEKFSKTLGADEYLEKPVDLEKIEEMINKFGGGNV